MLENLHNISTFSNLPTCWITYTTHKYPSPVDQHAGEPSKYIYKPFFSLPTCWRTFTTYKNPSPIYQHAGGTVTTYKHPSTVYQNAGEPIQHINILLQSTNMLKNLHNIYKPSPVDQHVGERTQHIKTLLQSTNILDNLHNMYKTFSSRPTCWKTYTTYIHPSLVYQNAG